MLPGELGEIPTTDDATNCNDITGSLSTCPNQESYFSSPQ